MRKVLFNLSLSLMISALVVLSYLGYLTFQVDSGKAEYNIPFIETMAYYTVAIFAVSAIVMIITMALGKRKQVKELFGDYKTSVCPHCKINISPDCTYCPNCKNKLK